MPHHKRLLPRLPMFAALLLLAACASEPKILVPEHESAEKQFAFALNNEMRTASVPTSEREKLFPYVAEPYEEVIRRYPDDKQYTPQAILRLGDLYRNVRKDHKKAIKYYERARKGYADNDAVQIYAKLSRAKCLETLGKKVEARAIYKECYELYAGHPDKKIQEQVKEARMLYNRVIKE